MDRIQNDIAIEVELREMLRQIRELAPRIGQEGNRASLTIDSGNRNCGHAGRVHGGGAPHSLHRRSASNHVGMLVQKTWTVTGSEGIIDVSGSRIEIS